MESKIKSLPVLTMFNNTNSVNRMIIEVECGNIDQSHMLTLKINTTARDLYLTIIIFQDFTKISE